MKITEFVYSIIEKFAPINPTDRMKLENEAMQHYKSSLDSAIKKKMENLEVQSNPTLTDSDKAELMQKYNMKEKIMLVLDSWYFRTFLALSFVFVVPKIQRYIQNYGRMDEGEFFDDSEEHYED